jgi:hypothetical protein
MNSLVVMNKDHCRSSEFIGLMNKDHCRSSEFTSLMNKD